MATNDFLEKMQKEAIRELVDGKKTWKEVSPNVLIMAISGLLTNHLTHKLLRPLWFFAGTAAAGLIWFIISSFIGI